MAERDAVIPPPPPGFTLDAVPPPPPGFKLDAPAGPIPQFEIDAAEGARSIPSRALEAVRSLPGLPLQVTKDLEHGAYKAGGAVTDLTGSPEAGFAANVAIQAIPTVLGGMVGSKAAPVVQSGAKGLMQSALKPSTEALRTGKAARAIDTMLNGGFNATNAGVAKMKLQIAQLNDEIATAINNSPATIDKNKVAGYLQETLKKFERQVTPGADKKAILSAWDEFLEHPAFKNIDFTTSGIPVKMAQEMKQGTYKVLGQKPYGELQGASTEAQKALARGLKEEIATAVPGVGALNKAESDLINALSVAERRVLMEANKNPMGLALIAHSPATWAAFMADRSGAFKSVIARMLHASGGTIPTIIGATAGAGVGASMGKEMPPIPSRAAARLMQSDPAFMERLNELRQKLQ